MLPHHSLVAWQRADDLFIRLHRLSIGLPTLERYELGSQLRRSAFSVAVNVDPDILILDEVFAVGDANFQAKCREKVMEFRAAGKTMLCVSHAAATIHEFFGSIW